MSDLCEDVVAIKVTEYDTPRTHHFAAVLLYRGKSFGVVGNHTASWPTYREALRAADEYRKQWQVPSDETLDGLDRIANDYDKPWDWVEAHVRENGLDAAWRRQ